MLQLASHEASQKPRRTKLADDGLDVGEIARVRTQRDGVANPTVAVLLRGHSRRLEHMAATSAFPKLRT